MHRLDTAPRRQRRTVRHDLDIAEHQLERAENYLERTRRRCTPAVERHTRAVDDERAAREDLRTCDTIDRRDAMTPGVGDHRRHVQALNTWKRWAQGHDLPNGTLHTTFAVLARRPGREQQLAAAPGNDLDSTRTDRNVRVAARGEDAAMRIEPPDLGMER